MSTPTDNGRAWTLPPCRSYLYVPATKPELFPKALASEADAVIVDLEDGVAPERKTGVHGGLAELLATAPPKPVLVRINALQTPFAQRDLEAVAALPITGIRIPKVRSAAEVAAACAGLRAAGFAGGLQLQIESAEGVLNLADIVRADPMVEMLSIGEGDLSVELACGKDHLQSVRTQVVLLSRACGLQRPVQGGDRGLAATGHLERTSREGRRAGFFGRIALHPAQCPVINRVYTRCRHEVDDARDALARIEAVIRDGQSTTRDRNGEYLSVWYRTRGERILREAERFGALDGCPRCRPGQPLRVVGGDGPVHPAAGSGSG